MSAVVEGKNVLIEVLKGSEYVPYKCATSIDYYEDSESIETSTTDSAGQSEYEYGFQNWGATLNGVTNAVPGASGFTVFEARTRKKNREVLELRVTFEDNDGNLQVITGRALVLHIGISAGSEGFSEDDIELKGTGVAEIATEYIDPEINETEVMKIEYMAAGGETAFTDPLLIGKTLSQILHVHRDVNALEPIEVGTPTDKQVKLISGTGTMSFASELSEGEFILILYK
jgi:hypothetical protein